MLREIHFAKKMDRRVIYSKTRFALLPAYDSREVVMADIAVRTTASHPLAMTMDDAAGVIARSVSDEAIHSHPIHSHLRKDGLLACARNDARD
jgi:hypothetical protein